MKNTDIGRIPDPEEYGAHIARLNKESVQTQHKLSKLEENFTRIESDLKDLTHAQGETKGITLSILSRFDGFESKIFNVFSQLTKDNSQLLQTMTKGGSKERIQTTVGWQELIKYVVGATIGVLIFYLFTGGN